MFDIRHEVTPIQHRLIVLDPMQPASNSEGEWTSLDQMALVYEGGGLFFFVFEVPPAGLEDVLVSGRVFACAGDSDDYIKSVARVHVDSEVVESVRVDG